MLSGEIEHVFFGNIFAVLELPCEITGRIFCHQTLLKESGEERDGETFPPGEESLIEPGCDLVRWNRAGQFHREAESLGLIFGVADGMHFSSKRPLLADRGVMVRDEVVTSGLVESPSE